MKQSLICVIFFAVAVLEAEGNRHSCKLKADVVFVVDSSASIWRPDYVKQLDFLANIARELNVSPEGTHVGAVSFSRGARLDFYLTDFMDFGPLEDRVRGIHFMQGDMTQTFAALRVARKQLFSRAHGARQGVPHIIMIVTDGNSSDRKKTKKEASLLRKEGIQVFAVGIGKSVDRDQLAELATKNTDTYVHSVSSFTSLSNLMPDLIPAACKVTTTPAPVRRTTPIPSPKEKPLKDIMVNDKSEKVCTSKKADVVFVLDKSSSITMPHFKQLLNFASDVMNVFSVAPDHTHISVVTFDYSAKLEFGLRDYFTKPEIRKAIVNIEYTAGSTNTFFALEEVAKHVLTAKGGYRKEVAHVVIVVTDGKSSNETRTKAWADVLKGNGSYVFAIGVGKEVDYQELLNIGSSPSSNFVFEVRDGYNALNTIKDILATRACEVPSSDLFVRCKQNAVPSDVMFVTHFSHEGSGDISRTGEVVKAVTGGIMTSEEKVRVGLVSSPCPGLSDVRLGQTSTSEQFANAVTANDTGGLAEILSRARIQLTKRRDVQRVAVVFVHGPVRDFKQATRQVMRAKSARNKPGVKFIFVGMGPHANEKQLRMMSDRRRPGEARVIMEAQELKKGGMFWQSVLTEVCEELSPLQGRK